MIKSVIYSDLRQKLPQEPLQIFHGRYRSQSSKLES